MKFKFLTLIAVVSLFSLTSCGGGKKTDKPAETSAKQEVKKEEPKVSSTKIDLTAPTMNNQGVGKYKDIKVADKVDETMAAKGKEMYKNKCTACHKFKKRYIGPALKGVTQRRSAAWIMNMVTNAKEMLEKDPVAKALITEYHAPMAQQDMNDDEVKALYEYLRTKN